MDRAEKQNYARKLVVFISALLMVGLLFGLNSLQITMVGANLLGNNGLSLQIPATMADAATIMRAVDVLQKVGLVTAQPVQSSQFGMQNIMLEISKTHPLFSPLSVFVTNLCSILSLALVSRKKKGK